MRPHPRPLVDRTMENRPITPHDFTSRKPRLTSLCPPLSGFTSCIGAMSKNDAAEAATPNQKSSE